MKCVCGYKSGMSWEPIEGDESNTELVEIKGDKDDFICTRLNVTYEKRNFNLTSQDVYICPKCGTLKINL